jgi:DNA invertase Pin-like site-specific DNA recombinase
MGIMGIYCRTSVETDGTSIDQQKKEGISFCKKNKFEFQVYEDEGKSGFKIDTENPFKNLKELKKLIDDIENKIVDKVWVFEHSRLTRNEVVSFLLVKIFNKNNITVYERDKQFDFNDPQTKMFTGILTQISQYERHLIVNRITRGIHDSINRGIRGYSFLYGYKKEGKDENGKQKWTPIKSEIENVRYSYQKFLEGKSINSIVEDIYKNKFSEKQRGSLVKKWTRILRHFENTGHIFNTEGLEIYNKFKNCEIDSIRELDNKKYYVKSVSFPIQMVSVKDWITVVEKLQVHKTIYKDKMRRTRTEMLTGIISCPYCEMRYYLCNDKGFVYYKHQPRKLCGQLPKSVRVEILDPMFEVFFFYFYLVYDDTKILIEENQRLLKINQLEIKEKIKTVETENRKFEKQINNFQLICEETTDKELLKLTLKKETEINFKMDRNIDNINKLKSELDDVNKKYNQDEMELTYYDVKELVVNFFENWSVEEKRSSLIKIIKNCQMFGQYIVIDTGKLLFIFNVKEKYELPTSVYNKFKRDKRFKDNFLNSSKVVDDEGTLTDKVFEFIGAGSEKELLKKYNQKQIDSFISNIVNYFLVRHLGDISISEINLDRSIRNTVKRKLDKLGIKYDLSTVDKIISFTEL